jgi:prepilin-type N-terminal cleavage/methylation domain-containing protein
MKKILRGFTLMEIAIVLAVLATLFGLVWINLLGSREKASTAAATDTFVSDLRNQQLKAMLGDTEGRVGNDIYGIFLGTTSYTMFHGAVYSPADPANQQVVLGDNMQFQNILFPGSVILFASGSGELLAYASTTASVKIVNTVSNDLRTVQLNSLGVVSYEQ